MNWRAVKSINHFPPQPPVLSVHYMVQFGTDQFEPEWYKSKVLIHNGSPSQKRIDTDTKGNGVTVTAKPRSGLM